MKTLHCNEAMKRYLKIMFQNAVVEPPPPPPSGIRCKVAVICDYFRNNYILTVKVAPLGRAKKIGLRTGNRFTCNPKQNNNTAVLNHLHECKCNSSINDFKIIGSAKMTTYYA